MQNTISRKIYLELLPPTEEDARGDRERILEQLAPEYGEVSMPLSVLRTLYPMCRDAGYRLTVTLVFNGSGWEVLRVEPGDTSYQLYGAAVDYGSTTLVMQVVDLLTGEVLTEHFVEGSCFAVFRSRGIVEPPIWIEYRQLVPFAMYELAEHLISPGKAALRTDKPHRLI